jgi:mono/diheme cytochrome c family protein
MESIRFWKVIVLVALLQPLFLGEALQADPPSGGDCRFYMLARADMPKVSPAALRQAASALFDAQTVVSLEPFFLKYGQLHDGLDKGGAQALWMEADWSQGVPHVGFWIEAAPTWKASAIREAIRGLGSSFLTIPVDYKGHPGKMGTGDLSGYSPEDPTHLQTWVEPMAAAPVDQSIVVAIVPRPYTAFDSDPKNERRRQATPLGFCEALAAGGSASLRALAPLVAESKFLTLSFKLDGTAGMTCRIQAKDESTANAIAQRSTAAVGEAQRGIDLPKWLGQPLAREESALLHRILSQIKPVVHGSVVEFDVKAASIAPMSAALDSMVVRVGRAIRIVESARHLREIAFECALFGNVHNGACPRTLEDLRGRDMLDEREYADLVRNPSTGEAVGYIYVPPRDTRKNSWMRGEEIVAYEAKGGRPDPLGPVAYGDKWVGWGSGAPIAPLPAPVAAAPAEGPVAVDLSTPKSAIITCLMAQAMGDAPADTFHAVVAPFLQAHCVKCHGPEKQKGDIRLDDLKADTRGDDERWRNVEDQLRDGLMPPKKEPRPDESRVRAVVAWAAANAGGQVARLPNQGNLIPHEALFGKPAAADDPRAATAPRTWRLSPDGYLGFIRDVSRGQIKGIIQPFTMIPDRGIRDYSGLYSIDEPSAVVLVGNAEAIVESQTSHTIKDGKVHGSNDSVGEFVKLMDPALTPGRQQLEAAIQIQYRAAIGRTASPEEVGRLLGLYETCAKDGDRPEAIKTMLQAVLLRTDAMFRSELAGGKVDGAGRRMLTPEELARSISLVLSDRRDLILVQAAAKGQLSTKEQVAAQVVRLLNDPKFDKPRLLGFFREYFEYGKATEVFKEKPADRIKHVPAVLVGDTDRLILYILGQDKDVLRELLTTPLSFVNTAMRKNKQTRKEELAAADVVPPPPGNSKKKQPDWVGGVDTVYGFSTWPTEQPVTLPSETRIGILMQPSWLAAWSTNFDNDPVRRGRWIRERLLGGSVPALPIGVAAQVPDEKQHTFRDRLTVTRAQACWKCHQRMDELGLPFENFDHYGRFRTAELVLDLEATAKNVDAKGKPLGALYRPAPLVTTGIIEGTGDPALDGPVNDPCELMRRLAGSVRVRQVFVRHVFRYFLGRNESLYDAKTLQDADHAYVDSGGSFKALVVSLLTSDAFLYRYTPVAGKPPVTSRGDAR